MPPIQSERLRFYPLSDDAMREMIAREQDPDLQQAYSEMLQGCLDHPQERAWYAVWQMELKRQPGIAIGDFSFKGPNPDGMVEIGYGLRPGYCGHGYMTEAVRKIAEWALSQPAVKRLEAETDPGNQASQKLLLVAGFKPTGQMGREGPRFLYCPAQQ